MTFKQFRNLVGRLLLVTLLLTLNLFLILRRAADPGASTLDAMIGLAVDPILLACSLIALLLPPIWLANKFPRLRGRLSGYTGMLLLANGLALFALLLAGSAPSAIKPDSSPTPVKRPIPPPVRPSRRTAFFFEETPAPSPTPQATLETTPTPESKATPHPRPSVSATPKPKPKPKPAAKASTSSPYAEIDAHALAAPPEVETSIDKLARYLVKPARDDREKIRAIHRWVADRVAYDTVSFFSGDYGDQSAEHTLKTRLSVCAGYANLVQALAEAAGVETVVVGGYARDAETTAEKSDKDGHAWNAVKLDGKWRLMDTTWCAGSVGEDQKFVKEYGDFYFLTDPAAFRNRHYPDDDKWQLIEPAIDWKQFRQQPLLSDEFYQNGLRLPPGTGSELKASPVSVLAVDVPEGQLLMAKLEDSKGIEREGAATVFRQGNRATVSVKAPAAGEYRLALYCGKFAQKSFDGVAEFKVVATRGDSNGYPALTPVLQQRGGRLAAPNEGVVRPGRQRFDLRIPGARTVFVNEWDQELQRDGDRFTGELELAAGEAIVYAQFDASSAEQVATYRVRYKPE